VDESAVIAFQPQPVGIVATEKAIPCAKWAAHSEPLESHENAHQSTQAAESNQHVKGWDEHLLCDPRLRKDSRDNYSPKQDRSQFRSKTPGVSNSPRGNIGFPSESESVDCFTEDMLKPIAKQCRRNSRSDGREIAAWLHHLLQYVSWSPMTFFSIVRACRYGAVSHPGCGSQFRTGMLAQVLLIGVVFFPSSSVGAADDIGEGLRDGWKWRTSIPAVKFNDHVVTRECRVLMWVEQGWLLVRRSTIDDNIEWQVVLARASDPAKPQIKINHSSGGLGVTYRGYFIRDSWGRMRIYRELKSDNSPEWPALALEGERSPRGSGSCPSASISAFELEQWCWIECGRSLKKPDLWVRLQPVTNRKGAASRGNAVNGFYGSSDGPAEMFYGDSQVQDEGDLFIGTRTNIDQAERGLDAFELGDALDAKTKNAPAIVASEWLNDQEPLSLDKLEGRAVLLYFWADWCAASVNKLPRVEQIHKKFAARDLTVIGIHVAERSDAAGRSVRNNGVSFPVMVDEGETAKRYRVDALPNCFLIDKSGKVVRGFAIAPPTDAQVEELLK
jgi:thiol-disulfide isomerase/thioredoxin